MGGNWQILTENWLSFKTLAENWLSSKILPENDNMAESIRTRCYLAETVRKTGNVTEAGENCTFQNYSPHRLNKC